MLYHSLNCTLMTHSVFSGNSFSTSFLTRRKRNGRMTWCSRLMISSCSSSFNWASFSPWRFLFTSTMPNHFSKSSQDWNTLGRMKLSSDQSSCRLFYRGVPVRRIRYSELYCWPIVWANLLLAFFMRCPSSTTMYFHSNLCRANRSLIIYS